MLKWSISEQSGDIDMVDAPEDGANHDELDPYIIDPNHQIAPVEKLENFLVDASNLAKTLQVGKDLPLG